MRKTWLGIGVVALISGGLAVLGLWPYASPVNIGLGVIILLREFRRKQT